MKLKTIKIPADLHKKLKKEANEKDIKLQQHIINELQKESIAETLLNDFESITSIEMAENIAENIFEFGSPARDTAEALAQNYKESKED